jgi:hypothetical protein
MKELEEGLMKFPKLPSAAQAALQSTTYGTAEAVTLTTEAP